MNILISTAMLAHTEAMARIMAGTMVMVLILQRKVIPAIAMADIMEATTPATTDTAATTLMIMALTLVRREAV